jgi:DNA modification methylase
MDEQRVLFEKETVDKDQRPVECLGMTFENDEKRREYFLEKLRDKLKDPEFRKIEGFPIGEDEDILALSDPPYYTACPNPFIEDFINHYGKPFDPGNDNYKREPFAADVSEGKNDPIYNAHSYHTKVPHKAIMRYILHYTEPGDIVFDGFCGTGMTAVAAILSGAPSVIESMGFKVNKDTTVVYESGQPLGQLGTRNAIMNDLSPAATFISSNYCVPYNFNRAEFTFDRIIKYGEESFGWFYKTENTKETINYIVWSDVFFCPNCQGDIVFWDVAVKESIGTFKDEFLCPYCQTKLKKSFLDRQMETIFTHHEKIVKRIKKIPILINTWQGRSRCDRKISESELSVLKKINEIKLPSSCPTRKLDPDSEQYKRDALHLRGIVDVSDFYTRRNLIAIGSLWDKGNKFSEFVDRRNLQFLLTSIQWLSSLMYRYRIGGGGGQQGKLTIPSLIREQNVLRLLKDKKKDILEAFRIMQAGKRASFIRTASATSLKEIPGNSVDYIFTDPPFGGNLFYSDLNSIWEGWLRVNTNEIVEAVVHKARTKKPRSIGDYASLMRCSFAESYRILKPGRWITIEFHNSSNSVWNTIQQSLSEAGFVTADVRTLDKKQGTFKQVTEANAVKQDLIISAYKPNGGLEERFKIEAGTEEGAWDFVRTHLKQLPVFVSKDGQAEMIAERQNYLLFDRMVAFHVQRGVAVPLSAAEFYRGLNQRFSLREGMYFLEHQAAEFDKKRMTVKEILQLDLFVTDEASAIQWLKQLLTKKPQTFQEIHPQFLKEIGGWHKYEKSLELSLLLEQNFLRCDGKEGVPNQVHSYLSTNYKELRNLPKDDPALRAKAKDRWYVPDPNNAADLEKLRERALLKEFAEYLPPGYVPPKYDDSQQFLPGMKPETVIPQGKKLKIFRLEAVRAGFKKAWQERDYVTIIAVARRISETVLQEDPKLLMWYDQARTRLGID